MKIEKKYGFLKEINMAYSKTKYSDLKKKLFCI